MKRTVLASAVAVGSFVAVPFAQEQPAPVRQAAPAHNVFVLTGCLEAGADAAAAFKLTNASTIGLPTPKAAETGAVGTSGQKAFYELRPVSGVNAQGLNTDALKAHVGERVEVIVRPIESAPAAPPAGLAGVQAPSRSNARPSASPSPS